MKLYKGNRALDGLEVTVDGEPLGPRFDVKVFSANGFEWSYEGSEPTQLALALLADHLGNDEKALALCEPFMREIVANFDNEWEMNSSDIEQAVRDISGRIA
jgi:hypothetical protein